MKSGFSIFFLIVVLSILAIGIVFAADYFFTTNSSGVSVSNKPVDANYLVYGQFINNPNATQINDFRDQMEILQSEYQLSENRPTQFRIFIQTYNECYHIRDTLNFLSYVEQASCDKLK